MKAYIHLIKYALSKGASVSIFDGEEWSLAKCKSYKAIKEEIEALEECTLRFTDAEGNRLGSALITPFEPAEETVADYSDNAFFAEWQEQYDTINQ